MAATEGDREDKRFKASEDNINMPMEFGTNRYKQKHSGFESEKPDGDAYQKSLHKTHMEQESMTNNNDEDIERINVKDLYKHEKESEAEFINWKKKEDEFEFKQMVLRSKIRLEDNRAKNIDLLARLYLILDGHLEIPGDFETDTIRYPYLALDLMKVDDLVNLKPDLLTYQNSEIDSFIHKDYWKSIRQLYDLKIMRLNEEEFTIDQAIQEEIDNLIEGRLVSDLTDIEQEIQNNLDDPDFNEEIDFWHTCITKIREKRSKMIIEKFYGEFLSNNKEKIEKAKSNEEAKKIKEMSQKSIATSIDPEQAKIYLEKLNKELEALKNAQEKHKHLAPVAANIEHKTPANVRFNLNDAFSYDNMDHASVIQFKDEQDKEYEEDENEFNGDVIFFKNADYSWSNKYKPRKPRFFNRVKTGYEWNPYNKKHFDADNPPPKIVQGYKFNIFYPDLINKQETPQYFLENCVKNENDVSQNNGTGEDATKLRITFKAGPPYEDIAFEIVNKEWEISERTGFKCEFDRGILHLYFNFKRHRYTR